MEAFGPVDILPDYPGYFWYGVHVAEVIYELMGTGCEELRVISTELMDLVSAVWEDDRTSVLCGHRFIGGKKRGATVITASDILHTMISEEPPGYVLLMEKVMEFFRTGISPISDEEHLEVVRYLEAVNRSMATGDNILLKDV